MKHICHLPIRIYSHNIRYATTSLFEGEAPWEVRRWHLMNELFFNTAHCPESFICLQEVLHDQLIDIKEALNEAHDDWSYVGVGRDDGKEAGEYSPIFYRSNIWDLQNFRTFWLSKTPDRPSKSWDAASIRILTEASFVHRQTKYQIVSMNTHLDDQGSKSRFEAANFICERIRLIASDGPQRGSLPIFVAGDFNSEPGQEAYQRMTDEDSLIMDLASLVPPVKRYGETDTFTGFTPDTKPTRIDFLFIKVKDSANKRNSLSGNETESLSKCWHVDGYAVLPNHFGNNGVYSSDHRAVVGDLRISGTP